MAILVKSEGAAERPEMTAAAAPDEVVGWLRTLTAAEGCVELRALGVSRHGSKATHAESTFYDPSDDASLRGMARDALALSGRAAGVYLTLNPAHASLFHANPAGRATTDKDVLARRWLLVDCDPIRPADLSSTDAEKAAALATARAVRDHLRSEAWPEPILADSGNGWHLLYRVDLPNDEPARELVRRCLRALAARFDSEAAAVDTSVFNAARIVKLYGTAARKGTATEDRPHRASRVLGVPRPLEVVGREWLEALAADCPEPTATTSPAPTAPAPPKGIVARRVDPADPEDRARAYLAECQPAVSGEKGHNQTFKVACKVGPGFGLAPDVAFRLLAAEFNPRCRPPWDDKDLRRKVDEAYKAEARRGWLLEDGAEAADPPPKGEAGGGRAKEAIDDPHRLARVFLGRQASHPDGPTLRYWLERWHRWDGAAWRPVPDAEVAAQVNRAVKAEFDRVALAAGKRARPVTTGLVSNVVQAMKGLALLTVAECPRQPAWIDGAAGPDPLGCCAARNGLVDLDALVAGRDALTPPTPRFFAANALDFDFRPDAPEPAEWLRFLGSLWGDDPESIESLQEWFGYLLTPDTRQQKMLLIIGPRRSGKGTIGRVLEALVGPANVAAPTLSGLATNFGAAPLIGKSVALIPDARLSGRADAQVIIERLLSISGQDPQTIDRKHREDWTGYLTARFVVVSNELPRLGDASGALPGRVVLLRLTRTFYGREDTELSGRLMAELPGILLWSIAGWERLRARKRFLQPESGRELLDDLNDLASPIAAFVAERCVVGPQSSVPVKDLYVAWKAWCESAGREKPGDVAGFGRNLRATLPRLATSNLRGEGNRHRVFVGVGLRPDDSPAF